jgi:Family of unknown function (DUF5996)
MNEIWPALPLNDWKDTYATLHMWTQIVGKIRLSKTPLINHWWNSTLYVTSRGLTTSPIPDSAGVFEIDFDFIDHRLIIRKSDGTIKNLTLNPRAVADFYTELISTLKSIGIEVSIHAKPDEVPNPILFAEDRVHSSYDPEYANSFWRILVQVHKMFQQFRGKFIGKCSPVHFFWGSFDLAVTRFSGRRAPVRPNADLITREAYSHEAISAGFWPGSGPIQGPAFYSYTAPAPNGLDQAPLSPPAATYNKDMAEFVLMYDDIRKETSPETALMQFLQSTYEAGANLAGWDRKELERES